MTVPNEMYCKNKLVIEKIPLLKYIEKFIELKLTYMLHLVEHNNSFFFTIRL